MPLRGPESRSVRPNNAELLYLAELKTYGTRVCEVRKSSASFDLVYRTKATENQVELIISCTRISPYGRLEENQIFVTILKAQSNPDDIHTTSDGINYRELGYTIIFDEPSITDAQATSIAKDVAQRNGYTI